MHIRERLLERLIALRKRAGLSARSLSLRIGRGEYYMSRIENGNYAPSIEDLERIAEACDSSLQELFSEQFESYKIDTEIIEMLQRLSGKEKDAVMSVLIALYNKNKIEDAIINTKDAI